MKKFILAGILFCQLGVAASSYDAVQAIQAIEDFNFDKVRELILETPDLVVQIDQDGYSLLRHALTAPIRNSKDFAKQLKIVKFLAPLSDKQWKKARSGYYRLNQQLNMKGKYGATPLHHAVAMNNYPLVIFLLENRANPNLQDSSGVTPLSIAVDQQNIEMINLLAQAPIKLNLNLQNQQGETVLHQAIRCGKRVEVIEALIWAGAEPLKADKAGILPFDLVPYEFGEKMIDIQKAVVLKREVVSFIETNLATANCYDDVQECLGSRKRSADQAGLCPQSSSSAPPLRLTPPSLNQPPQGCFREVTPNTPSDTFHAVNPQSPYTPTKGGYSRVTPTFGDFPHVFESPIAVKGFSNQPSAEKSPDIVEKLFTGEIKLDDLEGFEDSYEFEEFEGQ